MIFIYSAVNARLNFRSKEVSENLYFEFANFSPAYKDFSVILMGSPKLNLKMGLKMKGKVEKFPCSIY